MKENRKIIGKASNFSKLFVNLGWLLIHNGEMVKVLIFLTISVWVL